MPIFLRGLLLLLLLWPLAVFAADPEKEYQKVVKEHERLLASPAKQKHRENWTRVIDGYAAISSRHPNLPLGAAAAYHAGRAAEGLYRISRNAGDARDAISRLEEMARRYPDGKHADDALFLAGTLYEIIANPAEAWRCYQRTAEKYPKGQKAESARKNAARLARFAPREEPPPKSEPEGPKPQTAAKGAASVKSAESSANKESNVDSETRREAAASLPLADPSSAPVQMTGLRFWSNPGYTRVVLDLSGPVKYTSNFLKGDGKGTPPRLYVDLTGTVPAAGLPEVTAVGDGLLRQIRAGRPDLKTVRVVLDLMSFRDYKVFALEDPMRIILDIQGDGRPQITADVPELRTLQGGDPIAKVIARSPEEKPGDRKTPPPGSGVLRRIVVDAGHGGKDPGAIGPSGVREKDVTLAMARVLAKRLREELGCDVVLTRDSDTFLPLEERTAIANRVGADLFISIHANAAPNREAYGIETYYLNFSKNDKAAAVAARENGTSLKQVGDLELILFDLMANSKINESSRLAAEIQRALVDDLGKHYTHIRDLGVRQGPFYVLLGATMPSVLVETAFISHAREELRLTEADYHERSAAAIVRAVRSFANAQKMIVNR